MQPDATLSYRQRACQPLRLPSENKNSSKEAKLRTLRTACSLPHRLNNLSAKSGSFAVAGSRSCLFVGSITRAVKGMTDTSKPPPINHLESDLNFQAASALKKPTLAKVTCVTVALW